MTRLIEKLDDLFSQAAEGEYGGVITVRRTISMAPGTDYGTVERNFIATIDVPHADTGQIQAAKGRVEGHGEQTVLPDDCQFGDNDLCYVDN